MPLVVNLKFIKTYCHMDSKPNKFQNLVQNFSLKFHLSETSVSAVPCIMYWVYIEAWYLSGEGRGEVHAPGLNLSDYRLSNS